MYALFCAVLRQSFDVDFMLAELCRDNLAAWAGTLLAALGGPLADLSADEVNYSVTTQLKLL